MSGAIYFISVKRERERKKKKSITAVFICNKGLVSFLIITSNKAWTFKLSRRNLLSKVSDFLANFTRSGKFRRIVATLST